MDPTNSSADINDVEHANDWHYADDRNQHHHQPVAYPIRSNFYVTTRHHPYSAHAALPRPYPNDSTFDSGPSTQGTSTGSATRDDVIPQGTPQGYHIGPATPPTRLGLPYSRSPKHRDAIHYPVGTPPDQFRAPACPERPHQCALCYMAFGRRHDLSRHLDTHSFTKPHICQCGKAFTRKDALKRHMTCKKCGMDEEGGSSEGDSTGGSSPGATTA